MYNVTSSKRNSALIISINNSNKTLVEQGIKKRRSIIIRAICGICGKEILISQLICHQKRLTDEDCTQRIHHLHLNQQKIYEGRRTRCNICNILLKTSITNHRRMVHEMTPRNKADKIHLPSLLLYTFEKKLTRH